MIHQDKNQFIDVINITVARTGFRAPLLEKDYYLTLILSRINELSEDLIFKGGTCLNKIYYLYYRLSEDLDFSLRLPEDTTTRSNRQQLIQPIKDKIVKFAEQLGLQLAGEEKAGRNESKQYVYYFVYKSAIQPTDQIIKFEIGLRYNPICPVESQSVTHKFLHPFTGELLFAGGRVNCLCLKELVAEKLRAAATRKPIAPRDFYDIDFFLRRGFNLEDKELLILFQKKLKEDNSDPDLSKYKVNLGRAETEIKDMAGRIENELLDVLTPDERKNFDLDSALGRINHVMGSIK